MNKINYIFASRLLSTCADQLLFFLIPLVIYKITGSASLSGLSFALEWLPRVVAFLLSGLWGDRIGGGKLYVKTDFYRGAIVLFFLALLMQGLGTPFWLLTFLGGCVGFLSSQAQVTLEMTLKNNFAAAEIPKVQAKAQMCEQLSTILGPLAAGLILGFVPYPVVLALAGMLFFVAGFISKYTLTNEVPVKLSDSKAITAFMRGCSNIWNIRYLRLLVFFSILANFFYGVVLALNPAVIKGLFHESDQKLSLMYSIAGIVTITMLSVVAFLTRYFSVKQIGFTGISLFVASTVILSQVLSYNLYAVFYALLIAGVMLTNIMTRTYRVKLIPGADFGVTVGVIMFVIKMAMPLSGFFVAAFAKVLGLQNLILWAVAGSVLIFVLFLPLFFLKSVGEEQVLD